MENAKLFHFCQTFSSRLHELTFLCICSGSRCTQNLGENVHGLTSFPILNQNDDDDDDDVHHNHINIERTVGCPAVDAPQTEIGKDRITQPLLAHFS